MYICQKKLRQFVLYSGNEEPFIEGYDIEAELESNDSAQLFTFLSTNDNVYKIGVISYDNFHRVKPKNSPIQGLPKWSFVVPKYIKIKSGSGSQYYIQKNNEMLAIDPADYLSFQPSEFLAEKSNIESKWSCSVDLEHYQEKFKNIKNHIQRGDIYEMNYCIPFYRDCSVENPTAVFYKMQETIQAPHAGFFASSRYQLLSFSPERFIKRTGRKLVSQPIKGTAPRGENEDQDKELKNLLLSSQKERSENVMIVDLVRNDLSRVALKASVKVDELFGIYSFSTVHQMISTISCQLKDVEFEEILKATFPMGSMTGAPKISAMKIIDEMESFNRQWYSGALGYVAPDGDFDFNVVIRSFIYDDEAKKVMCPVGSAITINADAEQEYQECQVKFRGVQKVFDRWS